MFCFRPFIIALGAACCLTGSVFAQNVPVKLEPKGRVTGKIEAFPRLATGHPMAASINRALAAADARVLKSMKRCFETRKSEYWERKIKVTMAGPRYLAYLARDSLFCGGAHPSESLIALTFDLTTGRPVDWIALLPRSQRASAILSRAADGTTLGVVSSATLNARYVAELTTPEANPDCSDVLKDRTFHFQIWPDAEMHSLVIDQDDLPFAVAACGGAVSLPLEDLRKDGYAQELIDALQNAIPPGQ